MNFPSGDRALKTYFRDLLWETDRQKEREKNYQKKDTMSNIYRAMNLFTWRIGKINKHVVYQVVFWNGRIYCSLHAIQLASMNSFIRLH